MALANRARSNASTSMRWMRRWASTDSTAPHYADWFSPSSSVRKPSAIRRLQDGTELKLSKAAVAEALQYSPTPGFPELLKRMDVLQRGEHSLPDDMELAIAVGTGSQDLLSKAFSMLCGPQTALITEAPTYSGSVAAITPHLAALGSTHTVATDAHGLVPEELQRVLQAIAKDTPELKPVLYTIPTGSNPTGASLTEERRDEVMRLAREHNVLVLEDDPYYFLQYAPQRARSLLSRDTDGRVLRFDSFSKVLSSGLRVGTVSGPPALVQQLSLDSQASCLHPSGLSQAAVLALFQQWGVGASKSEPLGELAGHVDKVTAFYAAQCDAFMSAAEQSGLADVADFARPSAGMFVWMKCKGVDDTAHLIEEKAAAKKFLMVPGSSFYLNGRPSPFVRASFSTASPDQMLFALNGLVSLLK